MGRISISGRVPRALGAASLAAVLAAGIAAEVSGSRVDGIVGPQTWEALVSEALSG